MIDYKKKNNNNNDDKKEIIINHGETRMVKDGEDN